MVFLFGAAVFLSLIWWVAHAHAQKWRLISAQNPHAKATPTVATKLETIVIARRGAPGPSFTGTANYRQYAGTIIGVTSKGLTFSAVWPFSLVCPSFSVQFEQLELQSTSWAMWNEPFALRVRGQPEYDIILSREAVEWVRSHTNHSPFGLGT